MTDAITPGEPRTSGPTADGDPLASSAETTDEINFRTRKWVRPEDLNANGTLFGGSLLRWIDEEAAIYAILQLGNGRVVTKYISEINFVSSAQQGDLVEMGLRATAFGRTSLTMRAEVRNMVTRQSILTIDTMVFVNIGPDGLPTPHGYTSITYDRDRIPTGSLNSQA
jgi:acyl-CoA thioesterase YciA